MTGPSALRIAFIFGVFSWFSITFLLAGSGGLLLYYLSTPGAFYQTSGSAQAFDKLNQALSSIPLLNVALGYGFPAYELGSILVFFWIILHSSGTSYAQVISELRNLLTGWTRGPRGTQRQPPRGQTGHPEAPAGRSAWPRPVGTQAQGEGS